MNTTNIAILKQSTCIDANIFADYETAQQFFEQGVWDFEQADAITVLSDGFGIGDIYENGEWRKAVSDVE
jgi:hypothetical protein